MIQTHEEDQAIDVCPPGAGRRGEHCINATAAKNRAGSIPAWWASTESVLDPIMVKDKKSRACAKRNGEE